MRSDSPTGLHEAETSQIAPTSAAAANRILTSHTHVPAPSTIVYDMNIDHLKRWWPLLNVYGMSRSLPLGRSDRPRRPMYRGVGQWCTQQSRALLALASHWCNVLDAHTHYTPWVHSSRLDLPGKTDSLQGVLCTRTREGTALMHVLTQAHSN